MTIRGLAVRRHDREMTNKGKSRSRKGRSDFMRAHARQEARTLRQAQARQQRPKPWKGYDQHKYDGSDPDASEES